MNNQSKPTAKCKDCKLPTIEGTRFCKEHLEDHFMKESQEQPKANEYQCCMCNGIFNKGWSDEEAETEYQEYFPDNKDEREIVCDDCYNKVHPKDHPIQVKLANL